MSRGQEHSGICRIGEDSDRRCPGTVGSFITASGLPGTAGGAGDETFGNALTRSGIVKTLRGVTDKMNSAQHRAWICQSRLLRFGCGIDRQAYHDVAQISRRSFFSALIAGGAIAARPNKVQAAFQRLSDVLARAATSSHARMRGTNPSIERQATSYAARSWQPGRACAFGSKLPSAR
jgi:hypothetical protein